MNSVNKVYTPPEISHSGQEHPGLLMSTYDQLFAVFFKTAGTGMMEVMMRKKV